MTTALGTQQPPTPSDRSRERAALNLMEDAIQARRVSDRINADLLETERRLGEELETAQQLQSVSASLIEGSGDESIYQKLVDAATAIMRSDMASIQMVDERQDVLQLLAWQGRDPSFAETFARVGRDGETVCAEARRTSRRVIVSEVETCDFLAGTSGLENLRRAGIRAVQSTPLLTRAGQLVGVISTHWLSPHAPTDHDLMPLDLLARQAADLLERRRSEESTARLAAIVSSSDDAIVGKDLHGVITSWNEGAERLFGYFATEMIGNDGKQTHLPDRSEDEASMVDRVEHGERMEHFETIRRRKDGSTVDVSITRSPVYDSVGRTIGTAEIARDITGRREAKEALLEADRRKNEFLAMLAHELRGPLAPIRNGLQIILMGGAREEDVRAATAMMERQLGHMARLIDDLIDVSRISRGKLELRKVPIELTTAVRSIAEAVLPTCAAMRHELRVTLPPQPIHVNADPTRLAQVGVNLLNNACKFTDPGGRIELIVELEDGHAVLRVRDTGIGITPDQLPRIFDLFTQVDYSIERSRGGLGIGLSLVKDVVEMHGGTVAAYSAGPGQGSEFVVRLPTLPGPPATGEGQSPPEARTAESRRILVVDDNPDSADSLAVLLRLKGHQVRTAPDGIVAVQSAAQAMPELILMDLGLPRLNGFGATRQIRDLPGGGQVRIVAMTGWGQEEYRRRSEDAGFDAHLVKPVGPDDLEQVLAAVAGRPGGWHS